MTQQLSYVQLSSSINPSFWNKFTELKLNLDKLDETQHSIWGYFSIILANKECTVPVLEVDSTSFNQKFNGQNIYLPFHGKLLNKNTIEKFKDCNKMDIINEEGKLLYQRIRNGCVLLDPSLLNCFLVLSFADLKKYHYYYWFAFPVPKDVVIEKNYSRLITEVFSKNEVNGEYDFLQGKNTSFIAFTLSRNGSSITCQQSIIYSLKLPQQEANDIWVGWEKNEREKMGPRLSNLKNTLDPYVIAENSVDLNLKLMKWRVLPDIDLEKIKSTKCLLLGSGTLGCSVARALLAWGVINITFVDNSTVSFSNPVRQSLFTYLDSVQAKPKSQAAAENLKIIFPGVVAITIALGFDTYLVMRHGFKDKNNMNTQSTPILHPEGIRSIKGTELGCYFCNDVTAPGNRMRPAFYKTSQNANNHDMDDGNQSILGLLPHSVRGFLSSFEHILPATQKYKHCVACSDIVLEEYNEKGMDFLLEVFNSSKHLEDITHLTEMFKETDFGDVMEFSDEDFQ
ncbi:hypothetical protein NQ314_014488 [Rhamnusium bicolor]|uniref:Ubiquitin-like modifier-activating enzyme ATG7 n=1 Tax=Rhamnusium bicolor TaxID=1586634 RepID=A0AAV8X1J3_9CUCU|nr:hypothetical protein NQ314_014488 [Rhamnusium bicolor]